MGLQNITLTPLPTAFGVEVSGVDLGAGVTDAEAAAIHEAFLEHIVLVFREARIGPDEQKAFGAHFGRFISHPFRPSLDGHPEIVPISKEADETHNVGGGWHTDMTFEECPPLGTILRAVEVPEALGDTLFTNNYRSYEALSPGMQDMLDGMIALHCADRIHGAAATAKQGKFRQEAAKSKKATRLQEHPVVRTHPETGRKALFVNPSFTMYLKGMTVVESAPILRYLYDLMQKPEYVARVRWEPDTVIFWDNRCTQHYALNDYHGHRREMHRLMLEGDRPF